MSHLTWIAWDRPLGDDNYTSRCGSTYGHAGTTVSYRTLRPCTLTGTLRPRLSLSLSLPLCLSLSFPFSFSLFIFLIPFCPLSRSLSPPRLVTASSSSSFAFSFHAYISRARILARPVRRCPRQQEYRYWRVRPVSIGSNAPARPTVSHHRHD